MSDAEGILNLGGQAGPMTTRKSPVRAMNTTWLLSPARPAFVVYAVQVACAAGEQGQVVLLSDTLTTPTTPLDVGGCSSGGGGGGSVWAPHAIGSIDGVTVPGTPTFTGSGVTAISRNGGTPGFYDLTLAAPLNLAAGVGCAGVLHVGPFEMAGAPGGGDGELAILNVTDASHISIRGYSNMLTTKEWKAGISIWPIEGSPGGGGSVSVDITVSGWIYPGHNVRLLGVPVVGAPTFTVLSTMETIF